MLLYSRVQREFMYLIPKMDNETIETDFYELVLYFWWYIVNLKVKERLNIITCIRAECAQQSRDLHCAVLFDNLIYFSDWVSKQRWHWSWWNTGHWGWKPKKEVHSCKLSDTKLYFSFIHNWWWVFQFFNLFWKWVSVCSIQQNIS